MARGGVKIKGLQRQLNRVAKLQDGGETQERVMDAVEAGVFEMNEIAVQLIQSQNIHDEGTLLRSQSVVPYNQNGWSMINNASYAPYHEFGTGGMVEIPQGWETIAAQFKGEGKKVINIRPRPFFVPAFIKGGAKIVDEVRQIIKDATK